MDTLGPVATLDEEGFRSDLREPVGRTVEDAPNNLLGAETGEQVDTFPDGKSALTLATGRLEHVAESERGPGRYPDVTLLEG